MRHISACFYYAKKLDKTKMNLNNKRENIHILDLIGIFIFVIVKNIKDNIATNYLIVHNN